MKQESSRCNYLSLESFPQSRLPFSPIRKQRNQSRVFLRKFDSHICLFEGNLSSGGEGYVRECSGGSQRGHLELDLLLLDRRGSWREVVRVVGGFFLRLLPRFDVLRQLLGPEARVGDDLWGERSEEQFPSSLSRESHVHVFKGNSRCAESLAPKPNWKVARGVRKLTE